MIALPESTRAPAERLTRRDARRLARIARRDERAFARAVRAFLQGR